MKCMITTLFVFAVLSLVVGKNGRKLKREPEAKCVPRQDPPSHGKEYWGRFEVRPSTATSDEGWRLTVNFNRLVELEVWEAVDTDTSTSNKYKQEFVLKNSHRSNAKLLEGTPFIINFTARVEHLESGEEDISSLECTVSFEPQEDW